MKKNVVYVWTAKAEKFSQGKKKEGEPATYNGRPIKDAQAAATWQRLGWVREAQTVEP